MVELPYKTKPGRKVVFRRVLVVLVVVVVAGLGIGIGISTASATGGSQLITSAASVSTVSHTLSVSGDLEPVNQADAEFQVSGTVDTVDVAVGDKVSAGQTLATLDTSQLRADLSEADATLESAEAALTENEENETATTETQTPTGSQASTAAATLGHSGVELTSEIKGPPPTGSSSGSLSQDQAAVVSDQHTVDMDMQAVSVDLVAVQSACSSTGGAPGSGSGTPPTTTTTSTSTTTTTAPSTTTTTSPSTSTCQQALSSADSAEGTVSNAESTLATAESTLAKLLSTMAKSSTGPSRSTGQTGSTGSKSTTKTFSSPSTGKTSGHTSSSSYSGTSGSTSVDTDTPEQLASDESAIDADEADVVEAQQSLAAAKLSSPIDGTVEDLAISGGDSVSAASSSESISIVDWDSYEVTASLTTSQVQDVTVGQGVQITVDGVGGTLTGKVAQVGPVEDSDSDYVYPVVLAVTSDPSGSMPAGAAAQATIDLAKAKHVLVVPTSAVHTVSIGDAYVYLDDNGTEVVRRVGVGLVGGVYTQITSGLKSGDLVVLANTSETVPSSSSDTRTSFGGANSFGGAGGFDFRGGGGGGSSPLSFGGPAT